MTIDWLAFLQVFLAALTAGVVVVGFYALGLRLLARSGRIPVALPATFTDAITVLSPKQIKRAEKSAAKAAAKSPLTEGAKRLSLIGAFACFAVCALAVGSGILLIVLG
ncbi:peptidase [Microbacterium sp. MEC084]|uniref:peptidase n=1 Tax=Microbacterium sp. MEC084 TaxID=1963027 RepID=UPI00106F5105|nr:peptidase [Microbacterium sp. MEC084]MCD1268246.1 peptidase [Microbacterium sp. MEC084]